MLLVESVWDQKLGENIPVLFIIHLITLFIILILITHIFSHMAKFIRQDH